MMKSINYCFQNNNVASFYFDREDNCIHLTGMICAYNDSELLISHITPRGEYDGFILKMISDLYKMDYNGDYEKKIINLYSLKNQTHPNININNDAQFFSLIDFAKDEKHLISAELNNDKITGFVIDYDDDYITLNIIDDYARSIGVTVINIDEIVTLSCDTDYEQDLKLMYENSMMK